MITPASADHVPWYIFGIPPLILVLLPVTSFDCHIKDIDGKAFENVLVISIDALVNELVKIIGNDSDCLNNESNFFKKHSCDDTKKAAFLNRAAWKLKQFQKMNISENFRFHISKVSNGTLALVNCTSRKDEKKKDKQKNDPCFLKRLLEEIKTCWNKILMGMKQQ
ncbi:LOW QUALITY PROTEIN: interleukin-7 [Thomomys bottae]